MRLEPRPLATKSMQHAVSKASPFMESLANKPCLTYLHEEALNEESTSTLKHITWSDFYDKVEELAGHIQSLPIGRVTILLKRSCSMQIAQAACHLAGRTYIPLDPMSPLKRLSKLMTATDSVGMICDDGSPLPKDLGANITAIFMDMRGNCVFDKRGEAPYSPVDAPDIMYIMFTSGSTGEPKGVEVYTDSVWNFLEFKAEALQVPDDEVFIMKTPCTFDVSVGEMWLPLVTGTTSHVLGDGHHIEAEKVYEALAIGKVTNCHFVPSIMTLFLAQVESLSRESQSLPSLRMIQCTGEALKKEHRMQLSKVFGSEIHLVNLYGPTEAAIEVTYMYCEENEDQYLSHGYPIGRVPKGVEIFITDVEDPTRLVAEGEKGEICIGGIQVAKGYLNLPGKTASVFLPCPWPSGNDARNMMYRTGDLGRYNSETGWYEYNGRFDRQVKVGGVRIELGEVESVVMKLFGDYLEAAVVLFVNHQLIGVLVPKSNDKKMPTMTQVSDGILSELPKAYNPHEWHTIQKDDLPLSTAGKVDFHALQKLVANEQSVQVWAEVYDQLYDDNQVTMEDGADPTMDWASYKDSFNPSSLHRRDVVTEWVMETVDIITRLAKEGAGSEKAASVCEMGCGKGMIILKVAPKVKKAVCGDISKFAVKHVQTVWDGYMVENDLHGFNKQMTVVSCDAAAFEKLPKSISKYNVVVCNGVSMYLPSFTYLLSYFDGAFDRIHDDGAVFLGDIRSFHHSSMFQLRRLMQIGRTADEARAQAEDLARNDKDRCYDYRAFHALHELGHLPDKVEAVELQLKMGKLDSEFTGYRYDVTYHIGMSESSEEEKKSSGGGNDVYPVKLANNFSNAENTEIRSVVASLNDSVVKWILQKDETVFAALNIPNQRLLSDHLVAASKRDDLAYATESVGIKPSQLREALVTAFPNHHLVLTWSRDIGDDTQLVDAELASMDAFLVPARDRISKLAGLRGISKFTLLPHKDFTANLTSRSDFERCISNVPSQKNSSSSNDFSSAGDTAKAYLEKGDIKAAVETMVACSLGHTREAFLDMLQDQPEDITFEELGGNSFMAMKLILQLRSNLGAAPAVFKLLTEPLGSFLQDGVRTIQRNRESGLGEWIVQREIMGSSSNDAPVIIFFPTAGGSPKVYAKTYSHLKSLVKEHLPSGAKILLAQPPGRDARANEPNCTDYDELVTKYTNAIVQTLGNLSSSNKVVMCGDSLGSITCWSVAQELRQRFPDFAPIHMVVSGNPCPDVASDQYGLGTFAKQSIHNETDQDLLNFLSKGHASFGTDQDAQEVVNALRSDCILYEDFKRPANAPIFAVPATVCRGGDDPFVSETDMNGWKAEFSGNVKEVVLDGAGHHIYSEAFEEMAQLLVDILKQHQC